MKKEVGRRFKRSLHNTHSGRSALSKRRWTPLGRGNTRFNLTNRDAPEAPLHLPPFHSAHVSTSHHPPPSLHRPESTPAHPTRPCISPPIPHPHPPGIAIPHLQSHAPCPSTTSHSARRSMFTREATPARERVGGDEDGVIDTHSGRSALSKRWTPLGRGNISKSRRPQD